VGKYGGGWGLVARKQGADRRHLLMFGFCRHGGSREHKSKRLIEHGSIASEHGIAAPRRGDIFSISDSQITG